MLKFWSMNLVSLNIVYRYLKTYSPTTNKMFRDLKLSNLENFRALKLSDLESFRALNASNLANGL